MAVNNFDVVSESVANVAALAATTNTEIKEWHRESKSQQMLSWLSRISFDSKQSDILSKRHPGTGEWLLNSDTFKAWRDGNPEASQTLWCKGIRRCNTSNARYIN
jgi:hypothetical protein